MDEFYDFNILPSVYCYNIVMDEMKIFEITKTFNLIVEIIDFYTILAREIIFGKN